MCKLIGCNHKINDKENYCNKHKKYLIKEDIESRGGKICSNFERRKCINEVFDDNKRCEECRLKERKQSKSRTSKDVRCNKCKNSQKLIENNKPKRNRNWTEELNNNPERKEKRQEWAKKYCRTEENKYKDYKKKAIKSKREFQITLEEAKLLFHGECYYCRVKYNGNKEDVYSNNKLVPTTLERCGAKLRLKLNGIDRKNNDEGYIISNVVSCCNTCNFMKRSLNINVFNNKCKHILKYNNLLNIEYKYDYNIFTNHKGCNFNVYKKNAKKRNISFNLNMEEFNNIVNNVCYICGKVNSNEHQNGIDRINNNIGYIISNCKACCTDCNIMKNNYTLSYFFNKLKLIQNTFSNF
jgi:hypothetical protein